MKKRILLVEDHAGLQEALFDTLSSRLDALVLVAADGEEALRIIRMCPMPWPNGVVEYPDIIVSDIDMPRMNGLQLAAFAKVECPTVPMIFYSGGGHEYTVAARELGIKLVSKFESPSYLVDVVREMLNLVKGKDNE